MIESVLLFIIVVTISIVLLLIGMSIMNIF